MNDHPVTSPSWWDTISKAAASAKRGHVRAELLAVYRKRHSWKASDAAPLRTLPLFPVAERRVANLSGPGRPVVMAHTDAVTGLLIKISLLIFSFGVDVLRKDRFFAIKQLPFWPHCVEAVYRGEYEMAKASNLKSAAEATEDKIADALGISSAVVHKLCTKVRKLRKANSEDANFPPATLAAFMEWIDGGNAETFLSLD